MLKAIAAIVGPGNVGTDLMYKLLHRSKHIEPRYMVGIDPAAGGLARAAAEGLITSDRGVDWLLAQDTPPDIVFEATSASVHMANAPRYKKAGIPAIDLTPASVGQYCVPSVNMQQSIGSDNVSMITCGGQATVPIVSAISSVVPVEYAEIVSSLASQSAGRGTRENIDEFTTTTSEALVNVGGAGKGKAIIVLNPSQPPPAMRSTVFCSIPTEVVEDRSLRDKITESVHKMVDAMRSTYEPGYQLRSEPQFDPPKDIWNGMARVAVFLQVIGSSDYVPAYAGNMDIITAAAAEVGDQIAASRIIPGKEVLNGPAA